MYSTVSSAADWTTVLRQERDRREGVRVFPFFLFHLSHYKFNSTRTRFYVLSAAELTVQYHTHNVFLNDFALLSHRCI